MPDAVKHVSSRLASSKGRVLVVDDEANARAALAELLEDEGYQCRTAADGEAALQQMDAFDPDVVLTDLKMPRLDGIGVLEHGRLAHPHAVFVVITAFGSIDTAVTSMKKGADHYLTKPLDVEALSEVLQQAMTKALLARQAEHLRAQLGARFSFDRILGEHPSMQQLLCTVAHVAPSRATVLIQGESGTGKELIALAIHHNSPRKHRPFVSVNCAALAETLLESELFGHERGAFTGATARREGRFKRADGGTLFLDEVSEIPMSVQVKLLRFLQERTFERVGGNETLHVDLRIVAATNRRLQERVQQGKFREDLYYRLNVVQIDVPPLRCRRSDIPLLAQVFLQRFARDNERNINGFTPEALQTLMCYPWPGNVRELENAIERAVVLSDGLHIDTKHLPQSGPAPRDRRLGQILAGMTMAELERIAIEQTLDAVGGSTAKAAELLGISRRKIQYRRKAWSERQEPKPRPGAWEAAGPSMRSWSA